MLTKKEDQQIQRKKQQKINTIESLCKFFEDTENFLNAFRNGIFPLSPTLGTGHLSSLARVVKASDRLFLKILTPKQLFQNLPIPLAKVKASNTSENLLNNICQILYSLYEAK